MSDYLTTHRAFYDAVESGDVDLMASLWVDDPHTSCVHPGSLSVQGTSAVLRSWTLLMANVGYIQFFLTDVSVTGFPLGADDPDVVSITCTENILAADGASSIDSFTGGRALCTSLLVRETADGTGATSWKFWSRHASPLADAPDDLEEES